MPSDVLGRTRATMDTAAGTPWPRGPGNPMKCVLAWDWGLKLFPMNEEFPVKACHQHALITSLPFVHTAWRRYNFYLSQSVFLRRSQVPVHKGGRWRGVILVDGCCGGCDVPGFSAAGWFEGAT
ncbi:hypothetical protein ONE63_003551 [Megalurothrips usitatus]|uniref:Uncharacterized protein n=1 Tax=Megalurothrips usitatus TaxID=439358 RepID=A0AAV7X3D2_9NEOP|nr:hypothetical protein ONE63_003551 [Megalurothrips usitatus]